MTKRGLFFPLDPDGEDDQRGGAPAVAGRPLSTAPERIAPPRRREADAPAPLVWMPLAAWTLPVWQPISSLT